jgi:glutaredoxin-related protein
MGHSIKRETFIQQIRDQLSERLFDLQYPDQNQFVRVYDCLSKGKYRDLGETIPSYNINYMASEMRDETVYLEDKYLELISNEINHDIYILDSNTYDLFIKDEDPDCFYKNRSSIILLAHQQHFETVGVTTDPNNPDDIKTHFAWDAPVVQALRERYLSLRMV